MAENNKNEIEQELKSNLSIKLSNESCFDFLKRLDSNSISLILIDPPYEVSKDTNFASGEETGKDTVELAVMGFLKEYHREGIGKELFNRAKKAAKEMGYSFIQVKTVQMGKYKSYDDTNRFYLSIGFKELEVFPTLWDKWNPCQIYVMGI